MKGKDGREIIDLKTGNPLSVSGRIEQLKGDPQYMNLFGVNGNTTGPADKGTTPTSGSQYSGPNPFVKGPHFNLTRQGEIYRQDPELYRRLQAEAAQANEENGRATAKSKINKLNWTDIATLYRQNPALARKIAAEHGIQISGE